MPFLLNSMKAISWLDRSLRRREQPIGFGTSLSSRTSGVNAGAYTRSPPETGRAATPLTLAVVGSCRRELRVGGTRHHENADDEIGRSGLIRRRRRASRLLPECWEREFGEIDPAPCAPSIKARHLAGARTDAPVEEREQERRDDD